MPTPIQVGTEIKEINLLEILPPDEGEIDQIYGRIGAGKTYCATEDILEDLKRGQVWYVNWKIKYDGYDERTSKWKLFLGLLGLKREYFYYNKENLHSINTNDLENIIVDGKATGKDFISWITSVNDCKIGMDEGHFQFNSYEKTKVDMKKLDAIYITRHFDRTYLIISQRPAQIHLAVRANVNRFYKCEKLADYKFFGSRVLRFQKTEFQDTDNNGLPDETRKLDEDTHEETEEYKFAVSQKRYRGKKKIFESYDSKYRREGIPTSQPNYSQLFHMSWKERLRMFIGRGNMNVS